MAYATVDDVQARMTRTLSNTERDICSTLLDDAAVMIDVFKPTADDAAKKIVSCRMVIRAIGDGSSDVPIGATQSTMSALGYSQSWTIGAGGASGEIYLSKTDKSILGSGNSIGSYSPVEEMVARDLV